MELLHNNRCSKSRCALELIKDVKDDLKVRKYLEDPLSKKEIQALLVKLKLSAQDIIRKGEKEFKDNFKGKNLTEEEWIDAIVEHPKLMERPIFINGNRAVIGRPPERVFEIL
jgi:arsenate reductase